MVRAYLARDAAHARMLIMVLEQHGIRASIVGEALQSAIGGLPAFPSLAEIWVEEADLEAARRILVGTETTPSPTHCATCGYNLWGLPEPRCPECSEPFRRVEETPPPPSWQCPTCGETLEGHFTACWRCAGDEADL